VLVAVLTVLAVTMNTAFLWPQAFRLARTRSVVGVSPSGCVVSAIFFSVWTCFGIRTEFWSLVVANGSSFAASLAILWIGTRAGWRKGYVLLTVAGVVVADVAGSLVPTLLAGALIAGGVALRAPQLASLLRKPTVAGISPATWWLSLGTTACWLVIAVSRGATVVAVSSAGAFVATVALLMALYWRKLAAQLSSSSGRELCSEPTT
jgi:uncharacterized protein with PQ loop repeat